MPTRRQQRINGMIFEELALLVPGKLDDPRLIDVQVTRVETTQDLATSKVYVTTIGTDESAAHEALGALAHAESYLRSELATLGLRRLPHLVFVHDKAYESGERVLQLIHDLDEREPPDKGPADVDADAGENVDADDDDRG